MLIVAIKVPVINSYQGVSVKRTIGFNTSDRQKTPVVGYYSPSSTGYTSKPGQEEWYGIFDYY